MSRLNIHIIIATLFLLGTAGCNKAKLVKPLDSGVAAVAISTCSISTNLGTTTISCPDGSIAVVNGVDGTNGTNGANGADGANGTSCTVTDVEGGHRVSCTDGTNGFIRDGTNGTNGQDGTNGIDGTSCSVEQVEGGALITCTDGTSALIANGQDGADGEDS